MTGTMAHLHVHTLYSPMDSLITARDLARTCAERNIAYCAVTDHASMGGSLRAYRELRDAGVGPVLGLELWLGTGHLVVLAKDATGYENLMSLASGPSVSYRQLAARTRGLVALTACPLGHVPSALLSGDVDGARGTLRALVRIFDPGSVFVELQFHGHMAGLVPELAQMAGDVDGVAGAVATNDVHYLSRSDARAQDLVMTLRQGLKSGDPRLFHFPSQDYWLKGRGDMNAVAGEFSWALDTAAEVGEICSQFKPALGKPDLPHFVDDEDAVISKLAREGLAGRGHVGDGEYVSRLEMELDVIKSMSYSGYFLIVADFVNWAKNNDVAVGPGRGSGAGSLVAWCLGITDLDPVALGLFFERFLNPDRVSMPDFDIDFSQAGRGRVIDYVRDKYGHKHVAQIATYMTLAPKAAIKDVARAMGIGFHEVNELTSQIPNALRPRTEEEEAMSAFDLVMSHARELASAAESDPRYRALVDSARSVTGAVRQTGKHAGGVVIGRLPITKYTPMTPQGLTAYDMIDVESAGLVKFDFLGVKTLDVIDMAAKSAGVNVSTDVDYDDPAIYPQMSTGRCHGVFQIETPGMSAMCRDLVPESYADVVAVMALFRPGPKESGMVDDYIDRRHGRQVVSYPHQLLEPVLGETYGTMVYQEQVMQVAQVLAGYSLAQADLLRRAMGKKKKKEMDRQRVVFLDGCRGNGIDGDLAVAIFDAIAKHASYSFNKSHAAGYAMISCQTAWLKHYHPLHFAAALLTVESGDKYAFPRYVRAMRADGIRLLPPDVNASARDFVVEGRAVRWGLSSLVGVGEASVAAVIDGRPYSSIFDVMRIADVDTRVVVALIESGACDGLGETRPTMAATVARHMSRFRSLALDSSRGQISIFDAGARAEEVHVQAGPWSVVEEWRRQSSVLRAYLGNRHPVDVLVGRDRVTPSTFSGLDLVTGLVVDMDARTTASGHDMASVVIEDGGASMDLVAFSGVLNDDVADRIVVGVIFEFAVEPGRRDGDFVICDIKRLNFDGIT